MIKKANQAVDIFCSVSVSELEKIKGILIPSLEKQRGGYKIHLHLVDYTGTNQVKNITTSFPITVYKNNFPLGFGAAHNFLFKKVKPTGPFLIINPDVYCDKDLLSELINQINKDKKIGIVEGRQLPYEHPKYYDPKNLETNWASGACIFVNPKFFKQAGAFDEAFWMYCEDVDLSWRAWLNGYKVIHCPDAVVYHYTGGYFEYREDRYYYEHLWSGINFLYLSYKYWGSWGLLKSIIILRFSNLPKLLKRSILKDFLKKKKSYKKQRNITKELKYNKDRIGIRGFNLYE